MVNKRKDVLNERSLIANERSKWSGCKGQRSEKLERSNGPKVSRLKGGKIERSKGLKCSNGSSKIEGF